MIDFTPFCASFRERDLPVRFFLRDDDADLDEPALRRLIEICVRRRVPLSLAVIPATLTSRGAAYLLAARTARPDLIELHQHGWSHINHEQTGRKCEFGPSRSFDQQYLDVANGYGRMNDAFGRHWYPAFTPPWNRCTGETCDVLAKLGFAVLSTDHIRTSASGYPFRQFPITFDLHRWKGGAATKPAAVVRDEIGRQMAPGAAIGMLVHHKVMDEEAFSLLDAVLAGLQRFNRIRFETLGQRTTHEA